MYGPIYLLAYYRRQRMFSSFVAISLQDSEEASNIIL